MCVWLFLYVCVCIRMCVHTCVSQWLITFPTTDEGISMFRWVYTSNALSYAFRSFRGLLTNIRSGNSCCVLCICVVMGYASAGSKRGISIFFYCTDSLKEENLLILYEPEFWTICSFFLFPPASLFRIYKISFYISSTNCLILCTIFALKFRKPEVFFKDHLVWLDFRWTNGLNGGNRSKGCALIYKEIYTKCRCYMHGKMYEKKNSWRI